MLMLEQRHQFLWANNTILLIWPFYTKVVRSSSELVKTQYYSKQWNVHKHINK